MEKFWNFIEQCKDMHRDNNILKIFLKIYLWFLIICFGGFFGILFYAKKLGIFNENIKQNKGLIFISIIIIIIIFPVQLIINFIFIIIMIIIHRTKFINKINDIIIKYIIDFDFLNGSNY